MKHEKQTYQQKENPYKKFLQQNAWALLALAFTIFNMYLASQLAPVVQDISLVKQALAEIKDHDYVSTEQFNDLNKKMDYMNIKLDNFINKFINSK